MNPLGQGEYIEGRQILFMAESNGEDFQWVSSVDGELGKSKCITRSLSPGEHQIQLLSGDHLLDQINISVRQLQFLQGEYISSLLLPGDNIMMLPQGYYLPLVYAMDGGRGHIYGELPPLDVSESSTYRGKPLLKASSPENDLLFLAGPTRSLKLTSPLVIQNTDESIEQQAGLKEFIMADTSNPLHCGISVWAELQYSSNKLQLWLDVESQKDELLLHQLWLEILNCGYPRAFALWGDGRDIDGNGKLDVLLSHKINEQGIAVGFFNPSDFHEHNNLPQNEDYNPVSNEMNILYLADPSGEELFAYSIHSLAATFCHEYFHMVNYSNKVYSSLEFGYSQGIQEETFLDEGLAHLTESLCGYGESGGNLAFLSKYLEHPELYSLLESDAFGNSDSIGKRGAVSAFLSWIFWSQGGISWDHEQAGIMIDRGGMSFLNALADSSYIGWKNLENALGRSADKELQLWFEELNKASSENTQIIRDPLYGQILNMPVFSEDLLINGNTYYLKGPARVPIQEEHLLLPYSAIFYDGIDFEKKDNITLFIHDKDGFQKALFYMSNAVNSSESLDESM